MLYVRVQVRAEDHDPLQAVLQDWLMEKPNEGSAAYQAEFE